MSHNIELEGGKTIRLPTAGKYCDRDIVVTATGGGQSTPTQEKTVDITGNGTVEVIPDEGYALSKVTANVDVPIPDGYIHPIGTKIIRENTPSGETIDISPYARVIVEVPIPDGYIKPSGTLEITENRTYDVTEKASVVVNVESSGGGADYIDAFLGNTLTVLHSDIASVTTYACYGRTALQTINLPQCTSIGSYAFRACSNVTTVNAPMVKTLGVYAFYGCSKLSNIIMPEVTTLNTYVFYKCNLQSVNFPLATGIPQNAFFQNENLVKADFGKATAINQAAFGNCGKLEALILRKTDAICKLNVATNAFTSTPIANGTGYVYVPKSLLATYTQATNWVNYASQFRAIEDYPEITGG